MADFEGSGELGGDAGSGEMGQREGESMEDYIARLKKAGIFGGEITDQPLLPGSTSGSTAGVGAGAAGTNQGTTSGLGSGVGGGKGGGGGGPGGGTAAPSTSGGGSSGGSYSASAGGFIPAGDHNTFKWPSGGGGGGGGKYVVGAAYPDTWNTPMSRPENKGMNNANLLELMLRMRPQYVKPAYVNQANPFAMDASTFSNGAPARNYLDQLLRGGGR